MENDENLNDSIENSKKKRLKINNRFDMSSENSKSSKGGSGHMKKKACSLSSKNKKIKCKVEKSSLLDSITGAFPIITSKICDTLAIRNILTNVTLDKPPIVLPKNLSVEEKQNRAKELNKSIFSVITNCTKNRVIIKPDDKSTSQDTKVESDSKIEDKKDKKDNLKSEIIKSVEEIEDSYSDKKTKSATKLSIVKRQRVLHCLKSFPHKIADDDLIMISGIKMKGYIQSTDDIPRSSIQYRFVTMDEDKINEFKDQKKILTYGEICKLQQTNEEGQLIEEVREFLNQQKDNTHMCKEFIRAVRYIIKEYLKEPRGTTETVKRMASTDSYKTIKSTDVLSVIACAKESPENEKKSDYLKKATES